MCPGLNGNWVTHQTRPHSFGGHCERLLEQKGYRDVRIDPFDFLHPKTPVPLVDRLNALGRFLENVPLLSEFAGSLYIRAIK